MGALPAHLPPLSMPDFSYATIHKVLFPALVVTMLALTEAVSISRSIAIKSEQRIDGNQEFIGQGLSNLVGSFFSGYASCGSFNRSGVNYAAGAQTPLATVFASIFLVLILLLVAPLASYLPTAAMAGILFLVAWGLIDFHHIASIGKTSRAETVVLWVTLIGTLVDLEKGIFVGILLSLLLYLYRVSRPVIVPVVPAKEEGAYHFVDAHGHHGMPAVAHGAHQRLDLLRRGGSRAEQPACRSTKSIRDQKTVLIVASGINFVDVAGAEMLAQEARRRRKLGGGLYFYRCKDSIYKFLRKSDKLDDIGEGGFFPAMSNWIARLRHARSGNLPHLQVPHLHRVWKTFAGRRPAGGKVTYLRHLWAGNAFFLRRDIMNLHKVHWGKVIFWGGMTAVLYGGCSTTPTCHSAFCSTPRPMPA